ncbi:hypothetical protein SAMN04487895_101667 [Paenibacillus sophorae]|uniref:Uncharacterized protein n=1 Tax=Paenibacillus sophorae TaxID=1333845 RepID=A0A1H8GXQ3_9BACL|nr:hypothetical protein [Paenibacillus sophorae]QWU14362.1 hypothetical protein KP014_20870 [Paenibacillus sophorae]SEN48267.1 hypothetical protein SAMN04487895_101667 [Paenibacillus sophorae]
MGESKRRKLVGNIVPDPNWRRKLTSDEIREAIMSGLNKGMSDMKYSGLIK